MVYLHPVPGLLAAILFYWVATQGFRARHPAPYAARARHLHRRVAWVGFGLALLAAVSGLVATALLRDDLDLADSNHFWAAWALVSLLFVQAGTSLWIPSTRWARWVHMGNGLLALITVVAVAALGLGLLP